MNTIINVIMFVNVFAIIYIFIFSIKEYNIYKLIKRKIINDNKKYDKKIISKHVQKLIVKKSTLFDKIYSLLIKTGIKENKFLWWVTPRTVIFISITILILSIIILNPIFKNLLLTILFCIPIGLTPVFILLFMRDIYEEKIERQLVNYVIQLKNQAKITNDIIICFKNTINYVKQPISIYIKIFLFEIGQGVNVSKAFNNLKEKIDLDRFKQLVNNLESCYFNGGNVYNLLEKTEKVLLKMHNERNKRNEETMSARIVLIILICISIYMYFKFINFNKVNFDIMINNFTGQVILVFNFISIWIMLFLIIYVKRFDR